jgi:hypothetical protein
MIGSAATQALDQIGVMDMRPTRLRRPNSPEPSLHENHNCGKAQSHNNIICKFLRKQN